MLDACYFVPCSAMQKRQSTPQGGEKRKRSSKVEEKDEDVESPVSEDDSHEDDVNTTVKEESDDEETNSKEEEDAPKKSSNKNTSKKIAMDRPDSKLKETSAFGKKLTSAKSSRKSSGSTSKQGAGDGDRTPGSKLKGSASKKQKVGKEGSNDVKFSTKNEVPGKKQTNKSPAKVSTKTQATGKGKSSKKPKAEPSREEINEVVIDILKKVDFNTATLSDILRQLGTHFDLDLIHRKAEVKDIITEAINNMSDDEEGEESEENADTGEGADKDGNGNDDT
ncbi:protein DEK-like isoform X2 [Gossypium australe]|uniref:Protein DEK-like isoform X2 n=1 Tax=Gossypium australe TaxID=47621 RepID=A0A5B6UVS1_9ROSI|nr:protein DEK-like isoform X2 [Gossypium australe]